VIIVIQNSRTNLYFGEDGNWTAVRDGAKRFLSSYEAFAYCKHRGMPDCNVILSCDPHESVASPVGLVESALSQSLPGSQRCVLRVSGYGYVGGIWRFNWLGGYELHIRRE